MFRVLSKSLVAPLSQRTFASSGTVRSLSALKVSVFSTKPYDKKHLDEANQGLGHTFHYYDEHLSSSTAVMAKGSTAVCTFVNDHLDKACLETLASQGVKLIALRCAGFNQVDLVTAKALGLSVLRVPAYSPYAVAEHAIALIMTLNRKIHRAYNRVRDNNFALDGLLGFDMHGKTVGVIGTGKIGAICAKILAGFGCKVLLSDIYHNPELVAQGMKYVELDEIYAQADIISLHCPLMKETYHMIDQAAVDKMKTGVMLVNTSRGALVDTDACATGVKTGKIGSLALDVYEHESELFFEDLSNTVVQDDRFERLHTYNNVLITGHQAFFTQEALTNIAHTTVGNLTTFAQGGAKTSPNLVV